MEKRSRQYVHLSEGIDQAKEVGKRHGKLVLYRIDAEKMYQDGFKFYKSSSGVWLTDSVPYEYLKEVDEGYNG